ncbi:MAG: hypothetical protein ACOQNV_02960 [Mycoplasmoidaceae bacterium]
MKKIRLLAPIFALATATSIVFPLVCCGDANVVSVKVVDTNVKVTLTNNKAEKGKEFQTYIKYKGSLAVTNIVVKVGNKVLSQPDEYNFNIALNKLTIFENIITDTVTLKLEFENFASCKVITQWYSHKQFMVSDTEFLLTNNDADLLIFALLDYSSWMETDTDPFPNTFHIYYDDEASAATLTKVELETGVGSDFSVEYDPDGTTFKIKPNSGKEINTDTKLWVSIECHLPQPNKSYHLWGYHSEN